LGTLKKSEFKFQKNDIIGAEGAEEDEEFLYDCFVNTGDFDVIKDTDNPKCIVLGRTGSGKTALLMLLRNEIENITWLQPDQLSLQYLTNSTVLPYLEKLGVKLDVFYRLLWRHIFAVELIKLKYDLRTEADQKHFLARIYAKFFGDKRKKYAFDYLVEWGKQFWKDTEYRIHEVTKNLESRVGAKLGLDAKALTAKLDGTEAYTEEDRRELIHRVQEVVNSVQIQELSQVIKVLADDVFEDQYQKFFVVIDRLDESWVDDSLRYRLIRALIETLRDLKKIKNAKIVISIRKDLLDRVFRETRDAGFQEEKYQPLILRIKWTKKQLLEVFDKRLNKLVRRQYTKRSVSYRDFLPKQIGKISIEDYLTDRTLFRPRDIIQFGNSCIELAFDRADISTTVVRDAEARYSRLRFRSLGDEWFIDYPRLLQAATILLRKRPVYFALNDITLDDVGILCLSVVDNHTVPHTGKLSLWIEQFWDNNLKIEELRLRLVKMFYEVGLIGIRTQPGNEVSWSFLERDVLGTADLREDSVLSICPTFYRVLGAIFKQSK